jgi:hypothetical protein
MKTNPTIETFYSCPTVSVIRKKSGLGRFPKHNYQCALFLLRPQAGTRVRVIRGGIIEFMPNFDELRSIFAAIDPELADRLPSNMKNKPVQRKLRYDAINAKRHFQKAR